MMPTPAEPGDEMWDPQEQAWQEAEAAIVESWQSAASAMLSKSNRPTAAAHASSKVLRPTREGIAYARRFVNFPKVAAQERHGPAGLPGRRNPSLGA